MMRKARVVLAGAAVAAAAVAAGSAFTANNTFTNTTNYAGYGQMTAAGMTVTDISYTALTTDNQYLSGVKFKTSTNLGVGQTVTMTLRQVDNGTSTQVGLSPYTCTLGTYSGGSMTVDCPTTDNPAFVSFNTTGFTVVD